MSDYPPYLAAIDYERKRVFVLSAPGLSAIMIDGEWKRCDPLSDAEIPHYELVTNLVEAKKIVDEAKKALQVLT